MCFRDTNDMFEKMLQSMQRRCSISSLVTTLGIYFSSIDHKYATYVEIITLKYITVSQYIITVTLLYYSINKMIQNDLCLFFLLYNLQPRIAASDGVCHLMFLCNFLLFLYASFPISFWPRYFELSCILEIYRSYFINMSNFQLRC